MPKIVRDEDVVLMTGRGRARIPAGVPELEWIARLMDSVFVIPGLNVRFGLDTLLGLFPGLGDTFSSMISLLILTAAAQRGVPKVTVLRMASNIAVDTVVGSVPVVGDVFDVYWKANLKNIELLKAHTEKGLPGARRQTVWDWLFVATVVLVLILLVVGSVTVAWYVITSLVALGRGPAVPPAKG